MVFGKIDGGSLIVKLLKFKGVWCVFQVLYKLWEVERGLGVNTFVWLGLAC